MNVRGCTAIITGSSSGIGAATAQTLASLGCKVAVTWAHNEREGQKVVQQIQSSHGPIAALFRLDVRDDSQCRQLAQAVADRWGQLDILVNCAGTTRACDPMDLESLSAEDFLETYAVNVVGTFQMIRAAAPFLKRRPIAHVINISSTAARNGRGSSIAYAASKGALHTLSKSLARVLGPTVRVNSVSPGLVQSAWTERTMGQDAAKNKMRLATARSPLKKLPSVEDVASAIVACITGCDLMTGSELVVDSGAHLGTSHLYSTPIK